MCHVYVEEGDVLWTSGPSWLDLGNGAPGDAALLQQYWAAPSLPSRLCCLASPGIAGRGSSVQGAMRAPRFRFRCAASAAARSSSVLRMPCRIHTGVLGRDIGSGRGWVVVGWWCGGGGVPRGVLERWVWGCGPVGLWGSRGSFAALGMCVMRVMPHKWA